jgi:hypothetical protein
LFLMLMRDRGQGSRSITEGGRGQTAAGERVVVTFASTVLPRGRPATGGQDGSPADAPSSRATVRAGREAHDTAVEEAIAGELNKWLRAAGFEIIESRDEFSC